MKNVTTFFRNADQRYYQMIFLIGLLLYATFSVRVPHLTAEHIISIILSAQVAQWAFSRAVGIKYDFRSPLISSLSISILLASYEMWVGILAAVLMVASKFVLRANGKHIFNPANFAIVVVAVLLPGVAVIEPGLWGAVALWPSLLSLQLLIPSFVVFAAGVWVTRSIKRYDIAFFFLIAHILTMLAFEAVGFVSSVPLIPQFLSIAFLLFTFFMITDPKTIPDSKLGRLIFAIACAVLGGVFHYVFDVQPGFFYSLFVVCAFTPLIDKFLGGERFEWRTRS
jgi:Na+-translocating ferredoxin:NAD+ oxidoreductase RnfD subunit